MKKPKLSDEVGVYLYAQNLALRQAIIVFAGIFFADTQATRGVRYSTALRKVFEAKLRASILEAFHSDNVIQDKIAEQAVEDLLKELGITRNRRRPRKK